MRSLIPRLAVLGCCAYAAVGLVGPDLSHRWTTLVALIAAGLALTVVIDRSRVLAHAPAWLLLTILLGYCALIAVPLSPDGGTRSLDEIFGLLPVFFAAVFVEGWLRYGFAVGAALIQYGVLQAFGSAPVEGLLQHLVGYVVVARLASEIARVLRDALARSDTLHEVVAAATADPAGGELASRGLAAALRLLEGDIGAVVVRDGPVPRLVAIRGTEPAPLTAAVADLGTPYGAVVAAVLDGGRAARATGVAVLPLDSGLSPPSHRLLGLPIRYRDEVIGALVVAFSDAADDSVPELHRMSRIAEQVGLALGSMRAFQQEVKLAVELQELNRRKDEFLANVSHELRTPLTSIRLAAQVLSIGWNSLDEAQVHSTLEHLRLRSTELAELVESLLAEATAAAGSVRLALITVDWRTTLTRWVTAFEEDSGRSVEVELPADEVHSLADPAKVERIVANLLGNAAKFSASAAPIRLRLGCDESSVCIEVTDVGIGIEPEQLSKIFDRFYQADGSTTRAVGGVGIGLSLVRHFVRAHGGTVEVSSTPGRGSTFRVRLPRTPTAVMAAGPAPGAPAG